MATNLRLNAETAAALRQAAERSGRSQQELLREAVERYLGLDEPDTPRRRAIAAGLVKSPTPFRDVAPRLRLKDGQSTLELLDRDQSG